MPKCEDIFSWRSDFETGNPDFDDQNKQLVAVINALAIHLTHGSDLTLQTVFQSLDRLAGKCFHSKSRLSAQSNDLGHETDYTDFQNQLAHFKAQQMILPPRQVYEEILSYLCHCLTTRILNANAREVQVEDISDSDLNLSKTDMSAYEDMARLTQAILQEIQSMYEVVTAGSELDATKMRH